MPRSITACGHGPQTKMFRARLSATCRLRYRTASQSRHRALAPAAPAMACNKLLRSLYTAAMNYRHAFHAGNHADVLKHIALLALIDTLKRKDTPFFVLDTHAGRGRYQLGGEESRKTNEADAGVMRLMAEASLPEVSSVTCARCRPTTRPSPARPRLARNPPGPQPASSSITTPARRC